MAPSRGSYEFLCRSPIKYTLPGYPSLLDYKDLCHKYFSVWFRSLPCLFWCQHLWLCEEVEALLQGEVSRSGRLAQGAGVLLILQLLGAHQHVLLQTLFVFPHQLQGRILGEVGQQVLCREERGKKGYDLSRDEKTSPHLVKLWNKTQTNMF